MAPHGRDRLLSDDDFRSLSDQKAEDWRTISNVAPTLLGIAGTLFAAGVVRNRAWITVSSPVPLLLGVLHMIRNAKLQLQMITYLATHAPPGTASWERDIAAVRPKVWDHFAQQGLPGWIRRRGRLPRRDEVANFVASALRPSAWNTWLLITVTVGLLANFVAVIDQEEQACPASIAGVLGLLLGAVLVHQRAATIEEERKLWTAQWETHLNDSS